MFDPELNHWTAALIFVCGCGLGLLTAWFVLI